MCDGTILAGFVPQGGWSLNGNCRDLRDVTEEN
jgi:hypothetical protein